MALLDIFLSRAIKRGLLTVTYPNGKTSRFGTPDAELGEVALRFTDNGAIRAVLRDPSVGTPEMFMNGRLLIEKGDVRDLLVLMTSNNRYEDGSNALQANIVGKAWNHLRFKVARYNMVRKSKRNVAHHYDLSDKLYELFLDSDRQYSCAYFTDPANSLEQAQADKKAHIAAKLHLAPGQRVLDIGCGWGGMALYLNRVADVDVLGITLSEEQYKVARSRAEAAGVADRVRFELIDYRDVAGRFDRIVSVGMFEHVGPPHYRQFFRKCHDLLTDDGVMLMHTIGRFGGPGATDAFTRKYIFPGGYIPAVSEVVQASERCKLLLSDLETLRLHYALTIRHWYARTVANREKIVALYDERFYRMWTFYLAGAIATFESGGMGNHQYQFVRNRRTLPITRDYLSETEARLPR